MSSASEDAAFLSAWGAYRESSGCGDFLEPYFMAGWGSMVQRNLDHTGGHAYRSKEYEAHAAGRKAAARWMDAVQRGANSA